MTQSDRIRDLCNLGEWLKAPVVQEMLGESASRHNGWFTPESTRAAINAILPWLEKDNLTSWISNYPTPVRTDRTIGVVTAGNIPLAGFHDVLCVLILGYRLNIKLSSQDNQLIPFIFNELSQMNASWTDQVQFVETLRGCDATIATGSNNTARYFEYYFRGRPLLLRKNRNSVAVLTGEETNESLKSLADDMLQYFGLGCRSISHLFLPADFDLDRIIGNMLHWHHLADHHKFANSYTYQRAILMVDQQPFIENGFFLFRECGQLASPVATVHYTRYQEMSEVQEQLNQWKDQIQCIVARQDLISGCIPFGTTQHPSLFDHADGIDTMAFLTSL